MGRFSRPGGHSALLPLAAVFPMIAGIERCALGTIRGAALDQSERVGLHPRFWVPLLIAFMLLILYVFSKL